ncbi:ubiquitin-like-specific protease ESD4 [Pyrus ussuriensis x Pyrus communis]|uniref:Ubiquitin-like-specific protease ESD4 n=1 Tax=Pyrus ussuriensis x Pyrus communis TaxID=2448454 RepID=A0A5N5HMH8_9ROSA|nr:ubiquitin-like-specific protease ESD4 [Pyrus ussuriensis x Pyrus communis]
MNKDVIVLIIMESDLFGNEHTIFIGRYDIIEFCYMAEISTICISIYIRQLLSILKKNNLDGLCEFIDPGRISQKVVQLFMFCRFHWLLAIIYPSNELIYYMDSPTLKMFKTQKGIKDRKKNQLESSKGKEHCCPLQEGIVEREYYVMKYMKEIIDDPNCSIITNFKEKAIYTQHEFDALRMQWDEYVDDFIPIDETLD